MDLSRLILKEIGFRKLNFALGMLSVAAATGCLVAELTLLRKHDLRTEQIMAAKETETQEMMKKLEDDYRKITLKLGFNVLILPRDASLNDLHNDEKPPALMPEAYAERLAKSKVATINHVLPTLTQKVKWPERQRKVVLMGVRGEVLIHSGGQKPLLEAVPTGHVVVGYELHQSLGLKVGQKIQFQGREFTVSKLMDEKGNADDITLWINLREAQELLAQPGKINAILALECNCAADRLDKIRAEITALLPDTKVIEFFSQAIARAEARNRAA
jgi:putative ABC transport system permease protein